MVTEKLNPDLKEFLLFYISNENLEKYIELYNQYQRHYHNIRHINRLYELSLILYPFITNEVKQNLYLAIFFHDVIYNIDSKTNEEDSVKVLAENIFEMDYYEDIEKAILATKNHLLYDKEHFLSNILVRLDLYDLLENNDLSVLIKNENLIFKEYQKYNVNQYQIGRINFLNTFLLYYPENYNIKFLINYIENTERNIAIFAGSFNPFHIGHLNIVQKANEIFDKVIIAQGKNPSKGETENNSISENIRNQYEVINYEGLLSDFIGNLPNNHKYTLIRGLRNTTDLQYEITQIHFIKDLFTETYNRELNIAYIMCEQEYEHVSSSAVRELKKFNKHKKYLP
jgi:pantetheine-phosphate adenylyltransferase